MSSIAGYRTKVDELLAMRRGLQARKDALCASRAQCQDKLKDVEDAIAIARAVAQDVQQRTFAGVSALVTRCLEAVFDEPYKFDIQFEISRGKTEARLVLHRDGRVYTDPLNEVGGGVVDVAAFALRLIALLISRPRVRRVLILDEPFRFVAKDLHHKLRDLIFRLADELDVQFVIVTHEEDFRVGKVIELTKNS